MERSDLNRETVKSVAGRCSRVTQFGGVYGASFSSLPHIHSGVPLANGKVQTLNLCEKKKKCFFHQKYYWRGAVLIDLNVSQQSRTTLITSHTFPFPTPPFAHFLETVCFSTKSC